MRNGHVALRGEVFCPRPNGLGEEERGGKRANGRERESVGFLEREALPSL